MVQYVAGRGGFEPPKGLHPCCISSAVRSTAPPPARAIEGIYRVRGGAFQAKTRPHRFLVLFRLFLCFPYVNSRGIQRVFEVRGIEFLDHLNAGPAVFGYLVNVRAFHQPEADIGMAEAVGRSDISIPVFFQFKFFQNAVHLACRRFAEDQISGFSRMAFLHSQEGLDSPFHALAVSNATLSAYFDFQKAFA